MLAAVASAVSIALLGASIAVAPDGVARYLEWNLVIAAVPLALGYLLLWFARGRLPRIARAMIAVIWGVFLPNAPDLVHPETANGGTSSLDVATLAACAATGLLQVFAAVNAADEANPPHGRSRVRSCRRARVRHRGEHRCVLGPVLRWSSRDLTVRPLGRTEATVPFRRSPTDEVRAATIVLVAAVVLRASLAAWIGCSSGTASEAYGRTEGLAAARAVGRCSPALSPP